MRFTKYWWTWTSINSTLRQHHPLNKQAIICILVHRAGDLCDDESCQDELQLFKTPFRDNRWARDRFVVLSIRHTRSLSPDRISPQSPSFRLYALQHQLGLPSKRICERTRGIVHNLQVLYQKFWSPVVSVGLSSFSLFRPQKKHLAGNQFAVEAYVKQTVT